MPIRRAASYASSSPEIKEIALKEIEKCQNSNSSPPNCFIIVIIVLFLLGVSFEVMDSMKDKFAVSDS
jgi:hypothetical protein